MQIGLRFLDDSGDWTENAWMHVVRMGQEDCKPDKKKITWPTKVYSLHFIREGRGVLKYGDSEVNLKAGMCFVLYSDTVVEYYPDRNDPWSYLWIDIDGEGIEKLLAKSGFSPNRPYRKFPMDKHFVYELNRLSEIHSVRSATDICVVAQVFKLLSELIYSKQDEGRTQRDASARIFRVRDCIDYINNNYHSDMSLEDIAKANNISVSYMMSVWKKEVGMTPMEYLHNYRISMACKYLRETDMKIKQVAMRVGYQDEKYFARVFMKHKSITPSEYRLLPEVEDIFGWLNDKQFNFK